MVPSVRSSSPLGSLLASSIVHQLCDMVRNVGWLPYGSTRKLRTCAQTFPSPVADFTRE